MIAHFVPFPPHGGARQRNFNLLREVARNNDVDLITLNQKALLPTAEAVKESVDSVRQYCKSIRVFDIPSDGSSLKWYSLLATNVFSREPYSVWRYRSPRMHEDIRQTLSKESYDVIHVDTIDLAQYVLEYTDTPKVLNHHNVESVILLRRAAKAQSSLEKWYLNHQGRKLQEYERTTVGSFDVNVTVSDLDGENLQKLAPGTRTVTVSNGVDTDYFQPQGIEQDENRVIFVASLDWFPNIDAVRFFLSDIWPILKNKVPGVVMHLVGGPPPPEILEAAKTDPRFIVHGYVKDVRPHMDKAAVYIVPIRVGGGTRLKILDAWAMGKAVVSHSIGCEGLDTRDGENILIADSPEDIAEKTVELLRNRELRERLQKNARETALETYSWRKIGPVLDDVLRTAANKNDAV